MEEKENPELAGDRRQLLEELEKGYSKNLKDVQTKTAKKVISRFYKVVNSTDRDC